MKCTPPSLDQVPMYSPLWWGRVLYKRRSSLSRATHSTQSSNIESLNRSWFVTSLSVSTLSHSSWLTFLSWDVCLSVSYSRRQGPLPVYVPPDIWITNELRSQTTIKKLHRSTSPRSLEPSRLHENRDVSITPGVKGLQVPTGLYVQKFYCFYEVRKWEVVPLRSLTPVWPMSDETSSLSDC